MKRVKKEKPFNMFNYSKRPESVKKELIEVLNTEKKNTNEINIDFNFNEYYENIDIELIFKKIVE